MVQKGEVGTKPMGKIELLEAEENRVSKRVYGAKEVPTKNGNPINGLAVTLGSTAEGHEYLYLELLGAWEPSDSECVVGICPMPRSQNRLLIGDKDENCEDEESEG